MRVGTATDMEKFFEVLFSGCSFAGPGTFWDLTLNLALIPKDAKALTQVTVIDTVLVIFLLSLPLI